MTQSREYFRSLRQTPKGPLVPYIDTFMGLLSTEGYTPASVHLYTRLVADFSGWLKQKDITKEQITLEHTDRYLRYRASHRRRRKVAKKIAKNKRCYANTLRPCSRNAVERAMRGVVRRARQPSRIAARVCRAGDEAIAIGSTE